ncbi:MAG: A/G-specific adenine glycosylase [Bdellovibrionales bacterium]|nr:A/G-specific adenine glycosylase [Bdellovibrionales bacterium]
MPRNKATTQETAALLVEWYVANRRPLPWRATNDPYRIWISEVMLQQTTVTAVIPYYGKFLARFPNVKTLAAAKLEEVLEMWAGLGYYSRARALHASALKIAELSAFPKSHKELLLLPGFGPYTARAVASLAYGEKTGVVDGNVIRVLSRFYDLDLEWWKPAGRDIFQKFADDLVSSQNPSDLNQGLMELGATVCTPSSPSCLLCPWNSQCLARKNDTVFLRPLAKPRKKTEFWIWEVEVTKSPKRGYLLLKNDYAPFLKGHLVPPGNVTKEKSRPRKFDLKGAVTHHEIFVRLKTQTASGKRRGRKVESDTVTWVLPQDLKSAIPSSLVRKALELGLVATKSRS